MKCELERVRQGHIGGPFRTSTHLFLAGDDRLLREGTPCFCGQTRVKQDRVVSSRIAEEVHFLGYVNEGVA